MSDTQQTPVEPRIQTPFDLLTLIFELLFFQTKEASSQPSRVYVYMMKTIGGGNYFRRMTKKRIPFSFLAKIRGFSMYTISSIFYVGSTPYQTSMKPSL